MEEGRTREERGALLAALEEDLPRLLPDLEIVDRGLDLSRGPLRGFGSRRADFVALDRTGRALLVILVDGLGDETVLAAINALAFARQGGVTLARPARGSAWSGTPARVALVAESFSARALEGLALLPERDLLLFESQRVETSSGSRLSFARPALVPARPGRGAPDREAFLSSVPQALRGTAELLLRRLARVDAQIQVVYDEGSAIVCSGDREVCALETRWGGLQGAMPGLDRGLPIRGMDDADAFLDEVLREHLVSLGDPWSARGSAPPAPPPASEPLLSPEEIAAFRE